MERGSRVFHASFIYSFSCTYAPQRKTPNGTRARQSRPNRNRSLSPSQKNKDGNGRTEFEPVKWRDGLHNSKVLLSVAFLLLHFLYVLVFLRRRPARQLVVAVILQHSSNKLGQSHLSLSYNFKFSPPKSYYSSYAATGKVAVYWVRWTG